MTYIPCLDQLVFVPIIAASTFQQMCPYKMELIQHLKLGPSMYNQENLQWLASVPMYKSKLYPQTIYVKVG